MEEEKQQEKEGVVPPEATAGRYSRFHSFLIRTFSHMADRENGLDLQHEIGF